MANTLRVELQGEEQFAAAFDELGAKADGEFRRAANKEAASIVLRATRPFVPRRKGYLVESLRSAGAAHGGAVLLGDKRAFYAKWVVGGLPSHNIKPNPILERGMDAAEQQVHDLYYRKLGELLDSMS